MQNARAQRVDISKNARQITSYGASTLFVPGAWFQTLRLHLGRVAFNGPQLMGTDRPHGELLNHEVERVEALCHDLVLRQAQDEVY